MPIVIGIIVLAVVGAGAAVFLNSSSTEPQAEVVEVSNEVREDDIEMTNDVAEESPEDQMVEMDADVEVRPEEIQDEVINEEVVVESGSNSVFSDGTYSADASYFTPRRTQHDMVITLEVENDVVVGANVTYDGGPAETGNHTRFDEAYTAEVVGMRLDEVELARTGGASLTSSAFNEAVETIKGDATS